MRDIWEQAIEPTLLDFDGDAIMAGTPKGVDDENFFYQACNDKSMGWEEHHAPTAANPTINPEALARIIAGRPPLVVQQEYNADFVDWRGQNFFKMEWLLENGVPVDYPASCDTVYGVVDCAQKGQLQNDGSACIWFALSNFPTPSLVILDWDIIQIDGYFLKDIVPQWVGKAKHLSEICLARMGTAGLFIEDKATGITLLQQGLTRAGMFTLLIASSHRCRKNPAPSISLGMWRRGKYASRNTPMTSWWNTSSRRKITF